nr:aminotransferase class IV [Micromonospora sp. NBC_00855]
MTGDKTGPAAAVQNGTVWVDGEQADWQDARLPLMSDAVLRGLCVFDGLVARRQPDGTLVLVAADRHLRRLHRSCRALGLPTERTVTQLVDDCRAAAAAEATADPDCDVYVRPMVVGTTLTGRATRASTTVAAFRQHPRPPQPVRVRTSAWRRPSGDTMPPGLKVVGNYQLTRLARLEAKESGYDDALLLNAAGRLAEGAGSAVLVERDGRIVTPPPYEDCLDSITVALLATLAEADGIELTRQPVSRTEVLTADGLALAGTLADVVPVTDVDHVTWPTTSPLLDRLRVLYLDASRGGKHADLLEPVVV